MPEPTRSAQAAAATVMAAGVQKRLSSIPVMPLDGATPTPAEVAVKLEELAKVQDDVKLAKAAYEAALEKANAQRPEMTAYMGAVVRFVRAAFGNDPALLVDFGVLPIKPKTPLTVEEKAAAIAKRAATREARGTRGPRQKAAIHGAVTGVEIVPIDGPTTAIARPAPAATKEEHAPAAPVGARAE